MEPAPKAAAAGTVRSGQRSIYAPVTDFLLLGGGSLLILPLFALVPESRAPLVLQISFFLSFVINYPHFAHSYQIFYRDFGNKLRGRGYAPGLSYRYWFAGLAVPAVIVGLFAFFIATRNKEALGLSAGAMGFFVGWHYVKQGYGMLIVDSVFRKGFFDEVEKRIFRINAYACWIYFFLRANQGLRERDYLGLKYYFLDVPRPLLAIGLLVMIASTLAALWAAVRAARRNGRLKIPFNGYVAYLASLYIWLGVVFIPAIVYMIPAFHSLQYLAIVWKYEFNRERQKIAVLEAKPSADTIWIRFATFVGSGVLLGAAGFYFVPNLLDSGIGYDRTIFGSQLFTFMIFIFINIHHYFLDNVMWRKDNPDVRRHLFGAA